MILHSPESAYAKERRKWEALPSELGPGEKPWVYRRYPLDMYRATSPTTVGPTETASDEKDEAALARRGFFPTAPEALEGYAKQQREYATLAAEREYEVRYTLSDKAVAEVRAAEAESLGHLPTIPETPRPPKRSHHKRTEDSHGNPD